MALSSLAEASPPQAPSIARPRAPFVLCLRSVRSFGRPREDMGWRSDAPTVIAPELVPAAAQVCRGRAHPASAGAYDGRTLPCPMFLTIQFEGVPGIVGGTPEGEENRGGSRGPDSRLESGSENPNRRPPR